MLKTDSPMIRAIKSFVNEYLSENKSNADVSSNILEANVSKLEEQSNLNINVEESRMSKL
jgi:hypothetical protein